MTTPTVTGDPLLVVEDLQTHFHSRRGTVRAVDGVSFSLNRGETLGLVGESGSGKSITCYSIMRLLPHRSGRIVGGRVMFGGTDLLRLPESEMRRIRGRRISMILQDPMTSLNPLFTIGDQLVETVSTHRNLSRRAAQPVARELLENMHMSAPRDNPNARLRQYPHQMSGGQRQRVVGAMALAGKGELIIADEPTTSLDVTVQAEYLKLLKSVQAELGTALLFVTHDFGIVSKVCDRVAVMYAGRIVENGPVEQIFRRPQHPYTEGLLRSVMGVTHERNRRLYSIPGQPALPGQVKEGCSFAPRCEHVMDQCRTHEPPFVAVSLQQTARCWLRTSPVDV